MELFHSNQICGNLVSLDQEESQHCIKVLRHRSGDGISVIDGEGSLMHCRLVSDSPKNAEAEILSIEENWGAHPYVLNMAVCPTKNIDRYEWFVEKACEIGMDTVTPVIGEHSERKIVKPQRFGKILVSAAKQSLKAKVPQFAEMVSVRQFIEDSAAPEHEGALKLIAYCFTDGEQPRVSIKEALQAMPEDCREILILIGPEGDFSKEEASLAIEKGFQPIHLGPSRLRTETAALAAVHSVYSHFLL